MIRGRLGVLRSARDMLRTSVIRLSTRTPAIRMLSSAAGPQYNYILTSRPEPAVALITLNRPKALNALSSPLFKELNQALADADNDSSVGAIVLTGSEKAFAGVQFAFAKESA
jgi:enoyl-CoA hydratase